MRKRIAAKFQTPARRLRREQLCLSRAAALMACLRAALLAASAGALVIPTQPVLTRYAASKVLEAAEAKAKDED